MKNSLIATANAYFRYYESTQFKDSILEDTDSYKLIGKSFRISFIIFLSNYIKAFKKQLLRLQAVHCIRHKSVDELLIKSIQDIRATQILSLGAGLDTRYIRLHEKLKDVFWYEIDANPSDKKQDNDGTFQSIHYRVDPETSSKSWEKNNISKKSSTVIYAEGFVHYLSEESLNALTRSFDYFENDLIFIFSYITPDMRKRSFPVLNMLFALMFEIPSLFLDDKNIRKKFKGFDVVTYDVAEQISNFAKNAKGRDIKVSQNIAVVTRNRRSI